MRTVNNSVSEVVPEELIRALAQYGTRKATREKMTAFSVRGEPVRTVLNVRVTRAMGVHSARSVHKAGSQRG